MCLPALNFGKKTPLIVRKHHFPEHFFSRVTVQTAIAPRETPYYNRD